MQCVSSATSWNKRTRGPSDWHGSVDQLQRDRGRLAAADAERGEAAFAAMGLERRQQGRHDPGAAGADRMTERGRAAMDVDPVARDAEVAHRDHRNAGEGLVDLEEVDV